jgi:hypothetical protein
MPELQDKPIKRTLKQWPKLSMEQARFLTWLSLLNTHFEICCEVGYSYRKINGLQSYVDENNEPFRFNTRTLDRLINAELIDSKFVYPFGIKQQHYFLTENGQVYVSLLANNKDMTWAHFQKIA